MNNKNDGPDKAKADAAGASGSGPKKPYATLDLKATEVKTEVKETGKPADTPAKAEPAKPADAKATEKPGEAKPASVSGKPAEATATAPKTDARAAAVKTAEAAPTPKRSGSGIGGFFTHLAAGIIGGFLALLGADTIGQKLLPELGLPAPQSALSETTAQLQKRLAALEAAAKSGASSDTAKLAAAEARLAKLEEARGEVAKLAADARGLAEAAAKQGSEAAGQRLAGLEEKLQSLVAAAATDPEKAGRIPALAALTGKLGDLEASTANQLAAVRKSIGEQIESRMAAVSEASEQARSGVQRLDRDVAGLKSEAAKLRSDSDRLGAGMKTAQDDIAAAKTAIDGLRSDTDARMKAAAKPADVSAAVAPVASKLSQLEGSVESVVKSEQVRKANAERIVLSLELGNLKRVLDRGAPFAAELAEVKKAAGGKIDLAALDRYKETGVATIPDLMRDFRSVANAVLDADTEQASGSVVDRLLAGAKSVVRVRKLGSDADATGTEATLARMENALKDGRLGAVLEEAAKLPPKAAAPTRDWLAKVEARNNVDRAISAVEASLKASLASAGEATDTVKK